MYRTVDKQSIMLAFMYIEQENNTETPVGNLWILRSSYQ